MQHLGWIIPLAIAASLTLSVLGRLTSLAQQAADDGEDSRG